MNDLYVMYTYTPLLSDGSLDLWDVNGDDDDDYDDYDAHDVELENSLTRHSI